MTFNFEKTFIKYIWLIKSIQFLSWKKTLKMEFNKYKGDGYETESHKAKNVNGTPRRWWSSSQTKLWIKKTLDNKLIKE